MLASLITFFSMLLSFLSLSSAETKSQTRKPKCSKGYHCSRNAYMLVYKVQEEESSDPSRTNVEVPGDKQSSAAPRFQKTLEGTCLSLNMMVFFAASLPSEVGRPRQPQI